MAEVLWAVQADHLDEIWYKSYFIPLRTTQHNEHFKNNVVLSVGVQTAHYDVTKEQPMAYISKLPNLILRKHIPRLSYLVFETTQDFTDVME